METDFVVPAVAAPALRRLALASFAAAVLIAGSEAALLIGPPATRGASFFLIVGLGVAAAILSAVAGLGYLAASRRRGYLVGHLYAGIGVAGALLQLVAVGPAFGTATVVNLVFPAVTAIVLFRCRDQFRDGAARATAGPAQN